jgi:hypothetical protein
VLVSGMPWSRPLPKTIVIKDGRELKTLADARRFILSLPKHRQAIPSWQYVSELLTASAGGDVRFMREFVDQLKRVLNAEGLI